MKPYLAPNRVPILGMLLLLGGSIVLGLAIGALAYVVSSFVYYPLVFPLIVGSVVSLVYYKLIGFAKVRHWLITACMGLVTGLFVALAYHGSAYLFLRNEFIREGQKNYHVSAERAAQVFDKTLIEETGSDGLFGYMKLRAREGDEYTNYLVEGGMPVHEFNFTLKSTWLWLYWLLEIVFFSALSTYIGYEVGTRSFSESANDWYVTPPRQISAVPIEDKDELLNLLKNSRLQEASELAVAEEATAHPMLELYAQHSHNKKGDILLSVKETFWDKNSRVKRKPVGQWEVSEPGYTSFAHAVRLKLEES